MEQTTQWIVPGAICTDMQELPLEKTIDGLLELLEQTGLVSFPSIVKQDVMHREQQGSTLMEAGLNMPHAHTAGVTGFCAALGIVRHKELYLLVAWNEQTPATLQRLAALIETIKEPGLKEKLCAATDSQQAYELLRAGLAHFCDLALQPVQGTAP